MPPTASKAPLARQPSFRTESAERLTCQFWFATSHRCERSKARDLVAKAPCKAEGRGGPLVFKQDVVGDSCRTECQPVQRPLRGCATQGPFGPAALSGHGAATLMWSQRSKEQRQKPSRVGRLFGILIVLLFPFPLALLITSGVPLQPPWPYYLVYAAWIAFALGLDRIATHGWPVRLRFASSKSIRWPHLRVGEFCLGLLFVLFLVSRAGVISSPILIWSIWNVLVVVGLLEGAIVGSSRRNVYDGSTA